MANSIFMRLLCLGLALFFSLSVAAPHTTTLAKRDSDLYELWKSIPGAQKAGGDSALHFTIDRSNDGTWGITYMYGCTGIIITDANNVVVGHLQQVNGQGCISTSTPGTVNAWLSKLTEATDMFDPNDDTRAWILAENSQKNSVGVKLIKNFLTSDWDLDDDKITVQGYTGSSGTGEPSSDSPKGLAAVKYNHVLAGQGKLSVYFNQEDPIQEDWH